MTAYKNVHVINVTNLISYLVQSLKYFYTVKIHILQGNTVSFFKNSREFNALLAVS